jgi:protein transport protein SEC24
MYHLYPRLLAVHDLDTTIALPHPETGVIEIPSLMRGSHIFMQEDGIYLIGPCFQLVKTQASKQTENENCFLNTTDNEELQVLWIGQSASPQLLLDLLGVDDIFKVDIRIVRVLLLKNS